jgi:hypothetical protein
MRRSAIVSARPSRPRMQSCSLRHGPEYCRDPIGEGHMNRLYWSAKRSSRLTVTM